MNVHITYASVITVIKSDRAQKVLKGKGISQVLEYKRQNKTAVTYKVEILR